jgi:hypothetical protein
VKELLIAPAIGMLVSPLEPSYHWKVGAGAPVATTLRVAVVFGSIVWPMG